MAPPSPSFDDPAARPAPAARFERGRGLPDWLLFVAFGAPALAGFAAFRLVAPTGGATGGSLAAWAVGLPLAALVTRAWAATATRLEVAGRVLRVVHETPLGTWVRPLLALDDVREIRMHQHHEEVELEVVGPRKSYDLGPFVDPGEAAALAEAARAARAAPGRGAVE